MMQFMVLLVSPPVLSPSNTSVMKDMHIFLAIKQHCSAFH